MSSPIVQAIKQICEEKNLSYESVLETVESALASAYRKDFGEKNQNLTVEFNPETAGLRVFDVKTVVSDELFEEYQKELEERVKAREEAEKRAAEGVVEEKPEEPEDVKKDKKEKDLSAGDSSKAETLAEEEKPKFSPKLNIPLSEAKKIKKTAKIDDTITTELEIPAEFGRMAAQTAKQVITQRLREAERNTIYDEFKGKEHQLITGVVQRREGRVILVDLGKITGVIPPDGQIQNERYNPGDRLKVYVSSVEMGTKGPEITISRSHTEVVRNLFVSEIPEIAEGTVEIHAISREAGSRSKIAVSSKEENVDPVGSCIGQRGTRIQTIINELGGEKIDIVEYNEDQEKFIINALSPAKIQKIILNEEERTAIAHVVSDQLSLAIGKGGQNVRLAARLTGWKITIEEIKEEEKKNDKSEEAPGKTTEDQTEDQMTGDVKKEKDKKDIEKKSTKKTAKETPKESPSEESSTDKSVDKEKIKNKKPADTEAPSSTPPGAKATANEQKEDEKKEVTPKDSPEGPSETPEKTKTSKNTEGSTSQ